MRILNPVLLLAVLLFLASCSSGSVKEGGESRVSNAPDFTLPDQDGKSTTLKGLLQNNKGAVLAFYPKDDSKN
jgi:cytochrome oxidase Cu insertion factor (SCO1/SenC/PrrC family)